MAPGFQQEEGEREIKRRSERVGLKTERTRTARVKNVLAGSDETAAKINQGLSGIKHT